MFTVVGRVMRTRTPSARAGCIPPAAKTRDRPKPAAGSAPIEKNWVNKLSLKFRAAPARSPSFMQRPTKKKTKDTPARRLGEERQKYGSREKLVEIKSGNLRRNLDKDPRLKCDGKAVQ